MKGETRDQSYYCLRATVKNASSNVILFNIVAVTPLSCDFLIGCFQTSYCGLALFMGML